MSDIRTGRFQVRSLGNLLGPAAVCGVVVAEGVSIVSGSNHALVLAGFGFAALSLAMTVLHRWRVGFYFFLIWLLFADLARKYFNNETVPFFGKHALALVVYFSLAIAYMRGRDEGFRPPILRRLVPYHL